MTIGTPSTRTGSIESVLHIGTGGTGTVRINANGDVGYIECDRLATTWIGGDVLGHIHAIGPSGNESLLIDVTIVGSVLGDIAVADGRITNFTVNGDIGSSSSPVSLIVDNRIVGLYVNNIYGDIFTEGTGRFYCSGDFHGTANFTDPLAGIFYSSFFDPNMPAFRVQGDMNGDIVTTRIGSTNALSNWVAVQIDGDLNGKLAASAEVTRSIVVGGNLQNLSIAGTLESDANITADFITGDVILNADNDGGTWDGDITVLRGSASDITLAGPNYTNTPFQIGGGAVGLAPFNIHDQACAPQNGASNAAIFGSINIQHYGPITGATGSDPVTIWKMPIPYGIAFTDCTSEFTVSAAPNGRGVILTHNSGFGVPTGYTYRVQPGASLVCDQVSGNPPVQNWTYEVHLYDPFDLNMDGYICELDIDAWLAEPVDLNDDDVADEHDLAELILKVAEQ